VLLLAVAGLLAVTLSACDWTGFRYDIAHSGFTPDNGPANPSALSTRFTGTTAGPVFSSPAIANGVAYVGSLDGRLHAFDAKGAKNCAGTPTACTDLWTGVTPSGFQIHSSPAVSGGRVYVATDDSFVYAFDAKGVTNCGGSPTTCTPLASFQTSSTARSSPTIANGVLYVGSSHDTIEAFDANGVTNCSGTPLVCAPLWRGSAPAIIGGQISTPAVGHGLVYVGARDGHLYAYDAAGVAGCSGSPKVCIPVWSANISTNANIESSPTVAGDLVYIGSTAGVYAYDADGFDECFDGPTRACLPLWRGVISGGTSSSAAVAYGLVYIGGSDGKLYAFDADGVDNCSSITGNCTPIWSTQASTEIFLSSPAVAKGVVYIGSFHDVHAFDAHTGAPLAHVTTGGFVQSSPAVANGLVYIGSGDGKLYALG
jgi:outer membrane protein assembly factor BamB